MRGFTVGRLWVSIRRCGPKRPTLGGSLRAHRPRKPVGQLPAEHCPTAFSPRGSRLFDALRTRGKGGAMARALQ